MKNEKYIVGDKVTLLIDRKQNKMFAGDKCIVLSDTQEKIVIIGRNTGKEKVMTVVSNDNVELTK